MAFDTKKDVSTLSQKDFQAPYLQAATSATRAAQKPMQSRPLRDGHSDARHQAQQPCIFSARALSSTSHAALESTANERKRGRKFLRNTFEGSTFFTKNMTESADQLAPLAQSWLS